MEDEKKPKKRSPLDNYESEMKKDMFGQVVKKKAGDTPKKQEAQQKKKTPSNSSPLDTYESKMLQDKASTVVKTPDNNISIGQGYCSNESILNAYETEMLNQHVSNTLDPNRSGSKKPNKKKAPSDEWKIVIYEAGLKYIRALKENLYIDDKIIKLITSKKNISKIFNHLFIIFNEKRGRRTLGVFLLIFYGFYDSDNFEDLLNKLKEFSDMSYDRLSEYVKKLIDDFYEVTGQDLYLIWMEKAKTQELEKAQNFKELINNDVNIIPNERQTLVNNKMETPNINIPNFRVRVKNHFDYILSSIECTSNQKENISLKSTNILKEFISRAKNNEFTISSRADPKIIATSIVYTAIVSNENMPEINMTQVAKLGGIKSPRITYYYNIYFRELYPRITFDSTVYKLTPIKLIFSFYFFQLLLNRNIKFSNQIQIIKKDILNNTNLPKELDEVNVRELQEIAKNYPDVFTKYFSDMFNIVRYLMELATLYRIIGASIKILPIAKMFHKRGINLTQTVDGFHRSLTEIFDFLKEKNFKFFPKRVESTDTPKKERPEKQRQMKRIVGTRIKLYIINHIYNGKYFKKGREGCPKCLNKGLKTDITRIKGLEFHHPTEMREMQYTAENLYQLFINNQLNPYFLDDLIEAMQNEKVQLLCTNHHNLLHHEDYHDFKYLINWANIFSYPAEIIRLLIRVAVDNFHKTKDLTIDEKKGKRRNLRSKIKKKYVLEFFNGRYCPACGKFNTLDHLTAFHFSHIDQRNEDIDILRLFRDKSCSKIVKALVNEGGGFVCGNCHTVFHFDKYIPLLEEIFEDKAIINNIIEDYENVRDKYSPIYNASVGDPLKTSKAQYGKFQNYLMSIYAISNSGNDVTHSTLSEYMGLAIPSIFKFFKQNKKLVSKYIDINIGSSGWNGEETKYSLNADGEELIRVINHFRDYFSSIK